jgi:hypothetical protein
MPDSSLLLRGLEDYEHALARELVTMAEHHEQLRAAWHVLREVYQGSGADVFSDAWERADGGFQRYRADGAQIQDLLRRKVEALRAFDLAERPIP